MTDELTMIHVLLAFIGGGVCGISSTVIVFVRIRRYKRSETKKALQRSCNLLNSLNKKPEPNIDELLAQVRKNKIEQERQERINWEDEFRVIEGVPVMHHNASATEMYYSGLIDGRTYESLLRLRSK